MAELSPGKLVLFGCLGAAAVAILIWVTLAPKAGRQAGEAYAASVRAAPPADNGATALQTAQTKIAEMFASYDALPSAEQVKPNLLNVQKTALDLALTLPVSRQQAAMEFVGRAFRPRMAPLIQPPTRAIGDGSTTLVPSPKAAECMAWGSMWINDDKTLNSLATLGFETISCPKREWNVVVEASRCYLYWDGSDPAHEKGEPIFIWKDVTRYQRALLAGKDRGEEATMRYLALVSDGASIVVQDGTYAIVRRGAGWLEIQGTGDREGQNGIVEAGACHRKKRRGAP